jgi:hypothetical protein
MKKASKAARKISAAEFDARFDAGEDISARLDLSTARVYAPGEERLDLTIRKVNVDIPQWMIDGLDRAAQRIGVTRQSIVKTWLSDRLQETATAGGNTSSMNESKGAYRTGRNKKAKP